MWRVGGVTEVYLKRIDDVGIIKIDDVGESISLRIDKLHVFNSKGELVNELLFSEFIEILITDGHGNIIHTVI